MTFDFDPADYRAPHCNEQVLHAPGECPFCDKYPERQQARIASNTPFSPNEQAWPGNQAGGYGPYLFTGFMGGDFNNDYGYVAKPKVPAPKCNVPRGWYCTRYVCHPGPCAALPKWWNVRAFLRYWLS